MKLFKNKEEKKACCCIGDCAPDTMKKVEETKTEKGIKILGSGCAKCNALENATRTALSELHMNIDIVHITDFVQIASYGVMSTPALVFDQKVVSYGKVLTVEEVKKLLINSYGNKKI